MQFSRSKEEEPVINLTSLIDVVLLLLVFFMVSTSFVQETQIQIELPQAEAPENPDATPNILRVGVAANGDFLVNDRLLANRRTQTLRAAITKAAGERRDIPVEIRADSNAKHQSVVTAMDVIGRMGFTRLRIATQNDGQ